MVQTLWDATVSIVPLYYKLHSPDHTVLIYT